MSKIVYVGLDVSFRAFGLAIQSEDKVHTAKFGYAKHSTLNSNLLMTRGDRYRLIYECIRDNMDEFLEVIDDCENIKVFFEHYIMAGKGRICDLAELAGYIKGKLDINVGDKYTLELFEVPPSTLKKFVTGNGRAEKKAMQLHCEQRYGKVFRDDNECDAYLLTEFGKLIHNERMAASTREYWISKINQF